MPEEPAYQPRQELSEQPPRHLSVAPGSPISDEEWPKFVDSLKTSDPLLASLLENVRVLEAKRGSLVLGTSSTFYMGQLTSPAYKERLEKLARDFSGGRMTIQVKQAEAGHTIATDRAERRKEEEKARHTRLIEHPLTRATLAAFRGKIVDVRVEEVRSDD